MKRYLVFFLVLVLALSIRIPAAKKLTFEQAYLGKGEKLLNDLPRIGEWLDDRFYLEIKDKKVFKVDARKEKYRLIIDPAKYDVLEKNKLSLQRAAHRTADFRKFIFLKEGDLYLFTKGKNEIRRLTQTDGSEKNPRLSPDGRYVAYTLDHDLYLYDLNHGTAIRLTADGSEDILNGYASWVYYEEILGRRERYRAFWWSQNSQRIVFLRFDQTEVPVFPIFNAAGVYGELEKQRYPKPGFANPTVKIGIIDIKTRELRWIPFNGEADFYLSFPCWNQKNDSVYFQWLNRDQNHLKILCYDCGSHKIRQVYEEEQKTWVEFPGFNDLVLLKNDDMVIKSSKSGWDHIYLISRDGTERQVTTGEWAVGRIHTVDEEKGWIYFDARKEDSTETDFYCTDFWGKQVKRLTRQKGSHRVMVSDRGTYFIDQYSSITVPGKMSLYNREGKLIRPLGDRYKKVMEEYALAKPQLFRIKTDDGFALPARWYLPPDFDESKKYPVILDIYGGPGASSVRNAFGRRPLTDHFLASLGIIVMGVDHRGSGHFGKKRVDLMHRSLGKWEMHDYVQAVKYLRTLPFVDSQRIGITGGSYGGYVAALALASQPDYFQFGIAHFSVTDWRLYDSVYTERYMDTPDDNPEGYKSSSVLTYIDQYKGGLRITHGTMDDNVHMQNTLQFIDKVLDAGKLIELMLYPGERHGLRSKKRVVFYKEDLDFWMRHLFGKRFNG